MAAAIQSGERDLTPSPQGLLEQVSLDHKPVFVEIEQTQFRFRSRITLRDGKAMLSKPDGLKAWPSGATHVRLRLAGLTVGEMRLEVLAPHVDLGEGRYAFACAMAGSLVKNRRNADRFSAANRSDLLLEVSGRMFPIEDLSATGCRIVLTNPQQARDLPLQKVFPGGTLLLGPDFRVRLVQIMPRSQHGRHIGCEFRAARDDLSLNNLSALLDSLKRAPITALDESKGSRAAKG